MRGPLFVNANPATTPAAVDRHATPSKPRYLAKHQPRPSPALPPRSSTENEDLSCAAAITTPSQSFRVTIWSSSSARTESLDVETTDRLALLSNDARMRRSSRAPQELQSVLADRAALPRRRAGREVVEVLLPRLRELRRVVLPPALAGVDEDRGGGDEQRHEAEVNDASSGEALWPRGAAPVRPSLRRIDKQGPVCGAGAVRGGRRLRLRSDRKDALELRRGIGLA
jgi:hypothetical protein